MKINRNEYEQPEIILGSNNPYIRGKKRRYFKLAAFVDQYLIDCNIYAAWKRCGYTTGNYAKDNEVAKEAFDRPDVQQAIYEKQQKLLQAVEIEEKDVLRELIILAFSDITNVVEWNSSGGVYLKSSNTMPKKHTACVKSIKQSLAPNGFAKLSVELYDKKSALIDLGKHLGMFIGENANPTDPETEAKRIKQALDEIEERTCPEPPEQTPANKKSTKQKDLTL